MTSLSISKIAGTCTLAFAGVTGMWWLASPRVTDRYVALEIVNGRVVDAHVSSGKKMNAILPNLEYIKLPGWIQEFSVQATEKSQESIRTLEKAQVYGTFKVQYQLDKEDKNIGNIYSELKIDDEEGMANLSKKISSYVSPAANSVYSKLEMMSINDDLVKIGKNIKVELQKLLDEAGYSYIQIRDVLPSGVGLSPKANDDMEAILSEQRKSRLLDAQLIIAQKSIAVTEKQTDVTLKAIQKLKQDGGMTSSEALQAYYMTLMRVEDKIGAANAPGPIPGTGVGSYSPK